MLRGRRADFEKARLTLDILELVEVTRRVNVGARDHDIHASPGWKTSGFGRLEEQVLPTCVEVNIVLTTSRIHVGGNTPHFRELN